MTETLVVGELTFTLHHSERRRTVGITIGRHGELILTAPIGCSEDEIARAAARKQLWVHTKLAEKRLLARPAPAKEYITGEGFAYLGRSYRLLLIDASTEDVPPPRLRLRHGRFMLRRDELPRADQHFVRWYIDHGRPWIQRRVELLAPHFGVEAIPVNVRDLGYRWGSCGRRSAVNVHWRALMLPPRVIDYIVAHELVHVHIPNHSRGFWARLERAMPDCAERKSWLAQNGAQQ